MNRSLDESHTHTHGNLIYFSNHRCLSWSEESECMWTWGNDDTTWEFFNLKSTFQKLSHGTVITARSHTFTLLWSRKASVITKIYNVFMCLWPSSRDFFIFSISFLFLFLFIKITLKVERSCQRILTEWEGIGIGVSVMVERLEFRGRVVGTCQKFENRGKDKIG